MSYSQVMATIEVSIDIEDLGITDFDNLTDEQVLGLFRAYASYSQNIEEFDEMEFCELHYLYDDRHSELLQQGVKI